jgi:hypothetical protein
MGLLVFNPFGRRSHFLLIFRQQFMHDFFGIVLWIIACHSFCTSTTTYFFIFSHSRFNFNFLLPLHCLFVFVTFLCFCPSVSVVWSSLSILCWIPTFSSLFLPFFCSLHTLCLQPPPPPHPSLSFFPLPLTVSVSLEQLNHLDCAPVKHDLHAMYSHDSSLFFPSFWSHRPSH